MEIRITISGIGAGSAKTGFGMNLISGCYVETRPSHGGCSIRKYGVKDAFSLGSESSTLLVGHAQTHWMKVTDETALEWLNIEKLPGSCVEVEVSGSSLGSSKGDIKMFAITPDGDGITILEKYNIPMWAVQIASTKVRGEIKFLGMASGERKAGVCV